MNRLEKMEEFFNARLDGYEEHQMTTIEFAEEFYPYTAECLPKKSKASILDLGCGTGLELDQYFKIVPDAKVTGIDLAEDMLGALRKKHPDKELKLVNASYFTEPFGGEVYDAAVSVESLHHFTKEEKIPLYIKLNRALKDGGYFILTDYYANTDEEEKQRRSELLALREEQGLAEGVFYHYDTPLTVEHEIEALHEAGFTLVQVLKSWGATHTIKAIRSTGGTVL